MTSQVVFGTRIVGNLPKAFEPYFSLPDSSAEPLFGTVSVNFREVASLPELNETWHESHKQGRGASRFALVDTPAGFGLKIQCQGSGLFRITRDRIEIEWLPEGTGAEHYFFAWALPLWLEYMGVLVLHASAVSLNGQSIAFLAKSGVGKSSLAAGLTEAGGILIADDGLPILDRPDGLWRCLAGPPLLKLWPATVDMLHSTPVESLIRVHDSFEKRILPQGRRAFTDDNNRRLASIYLLERREESTGEVRIESVGNAASVIRLIEHSLTGGPASALGLSAQRFRKLADLVRKVPVNVLSYPSGKAGFTQVKQALLEDLLSVRENEEGFV